MRFLPPKKLHETFCPSRRLPLPKQRYMPNVIGRPDFGSGNEWRKFRVVPRSHHLRSLVFVLCLIALETEGLLDNQGRAGIISIVRWNLRPVIFGVEKSCRTKVPRISRIFVPNFALNFAPNFLYIGGVLVLCFLGNGDQKKFTKTPRHL